MDKIELIKGILKLGEELDKDHGMGSVMVIDDMIRLVDKYVEQLTIDSVNKREEIIKEIMQSDEEDGLYQSYSEQLKCCNYSCNEPVHKEGSVYCEFHKDM